MSLEKTVIDNIKRIRKEKGITQEQLAEACNTATSYIGLMEIYKNVPKLSTIERIAEALDVEPQILFQSNKANPELDKKISKIKNDVMSSLEKELLRSLKENI
ncbi:MAG: helix-turn-helix transcriptional regulator [Spirochaetales bacterium]|nr:helix-turn-helix transcriptional regulator [Spirochaetales bacterium]